MINGCTRNTPIPMPLSRPASAATTSATTIPSAAPPGLFTNVAVTKPAMDPTAATERSMPPVSMVSVWQPARIARGTEARRITPAHWGLTMPGSASSMTATRTTSSPISGTMGRSRNRSRQAFDVSHGLARASVLMRGPAAAG